MPAATIGGVSLILYGMISAVGVVMMDANAQTQRPVAYSLHRTSVCDNSIRISYYIKNCCVNLGLCLIYTAVLLRLKLFLIEIT